MKVFLSAGEASGDALGAALIRALRAHDPHVEVYGMGGAAMQPGIQPQFAVSALTITED